MFVAVCLMEILSAVSYDPRTFVCALLRAVNRKLMSPVSALQVRDLAEHTGAEPQRVKAIHSCLFFHLRNAVM
jgi:hypothetical protein